MGELIPYFLYLFDPSHFFSHLIVLPVPFSSHSAHIPLIIPATLLVSYCGILGIFPGMGRRGQATVSKHEASWIGSETGGSQKLVTSVLGLAGLISHMMIQGVWQQAHSHYH